MEKILVVSAWLPEQRVARSLVTNTDLRAAMFAVPLPVSDREHTNRETLAFGARQDVDFITTGIGATRAAMIVTEALAKNTYHYVIFCGTAGYYPSRNLVPGQVVKCTQTIFSDVGVVLAKSYVPHPQMLASPLHNDFQASPLCITTPSITCAEHEAELLGKLGQIENLEFYGMALAAAQYQVPWFGFFGLSNEVGAHSHEQWKQHHISASLAAQSELLNWCHKNHGAHI